MPTRWTSFSMARIAPAWASSIARQAAMSISSRSLA
jgi:hypothetical protein